MGNQNKAEQLKKKKKKIGLLLMSELAVMGIILCIVLWNGRGAALRENPVLKGQSAGQEVIADSSGKDTGQTEESAYEAILREQEEEKRQADRLKKEKEEIITSLLDKAGELAQSYYYKEAVEAIMEYEGYEQEPRLLAAAASYQESLDNLVPYDGPVSHVFFHSLIADNDKAFDGDSMSNGYNYWMTTVSEFNKILEQMYQNDYVLVSIHDAAGPVKKDGKTIYQNKTILLPPGKKPFVLSQDDVNYYEYMKTDGFAKRIVLDPDGRPACQMEVDGKLVTARDFDVVPLLEVFIEKHPDFSYHGARGIIALTGYEGALGYRTDNPDSETYEEDVKAVKRIAKALKKAGWEFASHSYGHRHMKEISYSKLKNDTDKWEKEVGSLVGKTDIYIYPYGEEIDYSGEKLSYLMKKGFRYYCGVYAKPWIRVEKDYVRMTRRNLDGFTMHFYPDRVADLYDLDYVFDKSRPEFK